MKNKPYFWPGFVLIAALLIVQIGSAYGSQTKSATNTLDAYAPFEELLQITPSDATTYSPPLRGCIVEGAGDLAIISPKNTASAVITLTVIVGQTVPAMITQVRAATTATVVCGR